MEEIQDNLGNYERKDIYSMDETVLYWKRAQTFTLLPSNPKGLQKITATCICRDTDGSDKTPVRFIRYYGNPSCFKDITRGSLGCMYGMVQLGVSLVLCGSGYYGFNRELVKGGWFYS